MENVNQTVINNANTVFEKKDDKYFGYKSRFGDIVIGGSYWDILWRITIFLPKHCL
ncbi:hypothetical protein LL3_02229 [Bacillus amyloliquefaciens LL3]|nr:hypothetical protein LL3_02229 [Bacillus amyloliquefaciens LL3]